MDPRILNNEDSDASLILFERARDEMDAGNLERAISLFVESNQLQPNYKTCLLLGDCLLRVGRAKDAVIPLAAATTLNRQGIAPTLLAEVFLELGEPFRAVELVKIALDRQPHYKRAQKLEPIARETYERWTHERFGN